MKCRYKFDTVGLFVNFNKYELHDVVNVINTFCDEHKINLANTEIVYNYFQLDYLQTYGLHNLLQKSRWFCTLSKNTSNFCTKDSLNNADYDNLIQYLYYKKSIAVFVGLEEDDTNYYVYDHLVSELKIPIIKLEQDILFREVWVGEPDYDIFAHQLD